MFGPDVLMIQALSFFGPICQDALALVTQGQIHRRGNLFPDGSMSLDLLPDGLHSRMRPQKPVRQRLVFPQETQQQMLGFDVRAAELASFVPRKENHSS